MAYKAGNLEVELLGIDNNAVVSINNTAKALSALSRAIDKINGSQFVLAGQKLEHIFTKIASATKSIDTTNLTALASAGKSLSAISRIGNLEKVDFTKIGKGFENLSVAITPFLEKVKSAEASLTALYGTLSKASGKKIQGLLDSGNEKKNGAFSFLSAFKWTAILYLGRRFGRNLQKIVQAGSDYTETLNLWQVAMKDNLSMAEEFVQKMNRAYGVSEKTLMNAQATFKNMIGSLGQISDTVAYQLSEAITLMAIDFSSLYNVQLNKAFEKFQAMLAGQVRPIRSGSGYDITETTLYQLYQAIGGTKTMRQLTRTEKQLLSILAVYKQMGASGALGDMTKTLNTFANQSRMMTEYWQQLKTWTGVVLVDLIEQSGVLVYINALLITMSEIMRAIAISRGAGQDNFIDGLFETTEATNEAVDELQGKLLDFDKFRSLSGAEENVLGIDEQLLKAITGYSSQIDKAQNSAQQLADEWLGILGFTEDANGEFTITDGKLNRIKNVLKTILGIVGAIFGLGIISAIVKLGMTLNTYAIQPLKTLSIKLVGWFQSIQLQGALATTTMQKFSVVMGYVGRAVLMAVMSFTLFDSIISGLDGTARQTVSIISIIVGALATLLGVILAIKGGLKGGLIGATIAGLGVGALLAGIKGVATQNATIDAYANGGLPDKGTLFRAGEAGAEIVYNTPSGQSGVVNVQQIEQAMYGALVRYGKSNGGNGQPIKVYLDGEKVYQNTTAHAKRRGNVWGKA